MSQDGDAQSTSPTLSSDSSVLSQSTCPTSVDGHDNFATTKVLHGGRPRRPTSYIQRRHPSRQSVDTQSSTRTQSDRDGTVSPPVDPSERPSADRFDSLQDLLEQAGYKDTRVITPQSKVLAQFAQEHEDASATPTQRPRNLRSDSIAEEQTEGAARNHADGHSDVEDRTPRNSMIMDGAESSRAGGGSWFTSLWRGTSPSGSDKTCGRASPTPPANAAASKDDTRTPPASPTKRTPTASAYARTGSPEKLSGSPKVSEGSPLRRAARRANTSPLVKRQGTAAHLPLWKGSQAYRSTGNLKESQSQDKASSSTALKSKGSLGHLRGGGHAASVGVGISATDGGAIFGSLRKTTSSKTPEGGRVKEARAAQIKRTERSEAHAHTRTSSTDSIEEWRRSLTRIQGPRRPAITIETADDVASPPRFKLKPAAPQVTVSADLFASLATPLISPDLAVAPRNSDCFRGPDRNGLRHAKSVEALKTALQARKNPLLRERHSVIGQRAPNADEVPPVPALPSFPSNPSIVSSVGTTNAKTVYQDNELPPASPERPQGPPILTLTSPTGVHSPQVVKLEGKEFDPQHFSPPPKSLFWSHRPIPAPPTADKAVREEDDAADAAPEEEDQPIARRRKGRVGGGLHRKPSLDGSQSGESDPGALGLPKRTRRGCRGGRKHNRGRKNGSDSAGSGSELDSPTKKLLRHASPGSLAKVSASQALRQSASTRASERARGSTMGSFGTAIQELAEVHVDDGEDDPFIAHVTAQEAKRPVFGSKAQNQQQGIASILSSDGENDENAPPRASALSGRSDSQRSMPAGAARALKGRIVGRSRPISSASSSSCEEEEMRFGAAPADLNAARPAVVRRMTSSAASEHRRSPSVESPTKELARRLKRSQGRGV